MALVLADRVRETTASVGTGALILQGAYPGFQPFSVIGNGSTTYYAIIDQATSDWEIGVGTYSATSNSLSRDTVLTSSTGSLVAFESGTKDVILTQPAAKAVLKDVAGNVGIGVVPSAWSPRALQVGSWGGLQDMGGVADQIALRGNLYYNAGDKFLNASGYATTLALDANAGFVFYTSSTPSGGAGSAASLATRMTLDTSGNLGLGVTPSAWGFGGNLQTAVGAYHAGANYTYRTANVYFNGGEKYIATAPACKYSQFDGIHAFYTAPAGTAGNAISFTQAMTLDASGNLAVGGTATAYASARALTVDGAGDTVLVFRRSGGVTGALYSATAQLDLSAAGAVPITFSNNGVERARIDSAGNLGLGVVPSAWGGGYKAFENVGGALYAGTTNAMFLGQNAYYNGTNNIYKNSNFASAYGQNAGVHQWFTAPAGTAGNAISFTQAMTLDASGRLGVGTTSPQQSIQTNGRVRVSTDNANGGDIGVDAGGLAISSLGATPIIFSRNTFANESARIDSSGNLLVGTTTLASGSRMAVQTTSGKFDVRAFGGASVTLNSSAALGYNAATGNGHIWQINDSEVARIDASGNLGIGTSSPGAKLDVLGNARIQQANYTDAVLRISQGALTTGNASQILFQDQLTNTTASITAYGSAWGSGSNYALAFATNGAERMRLDAAGNLGLGVVPSAWDAGNKVFQLGTSAALWSVSAYTLLSQNEYTNGGVNKYIANGYATRYGQLNGAHQWYTAPSGTAGDAISFTQAMTLDASGNLLVGTTSSSGLGKLEVNGGTGIRVNEDNVGTKVISLRSDFAGVGPAINVTTSHPLLFLTANTERARIDSGGNLIVGGTNSVYGAANRGVITINGASQALLGFTVGSADKGFLYHTGTDMTLSNTAAGAVVLQTNNTERARIHASGNVSIGNTNDTYKLDVTGDINFSGTLYKNGVPVGGGSGGGDVYGPASSTNNSVVLFDGTSGKVLKAPSDTFVLDGAGNLGIGTPSPGYRLSVSRGSAGVIANITDGVAQSLQITTGSGYVGFLNPNYGAITFRDGGNVTEFMRLDASGNLGLGVVPSAWSSPGLKALQVSNAALSGNTASAFIGNNSYFTGAYQNTYISTAPAQQIALNRTGGNDIQFLVAPSGNAGDAISFTQAMTLDANGHLMVGATSASGRLTVTGTSGSTVIEYGGDALAFTKNGLNFITAKGGSSAALVFETGGANERARIDASGNLLVGTTSASALAAAGRGLIEANGSTDAAVVLKSNNTIAAYLYADSTAARVAAGGTSPLVLWVNSAERARIHASGGVSIGNTTDPGANNLNVTGSISAAAGIKSRTVAAASATSVTPNCDTSDLVTQANTQAAGTLTINAPTGTPQDGQKLTLRLTCANVQTLSWGAAFAGSTDLALPTATSGGGKCDYIGFIYNAAAVKWQMVAKTFGF